MDMAGSTIEIPERLLPGKAPLADRLPWHILRRVGRSDQHALDWLKRMALETYYPQVREMRPIPRMKLSHKQRMAGTTIMRPTVAPLFPGYLFVRMNLAGMDWKQMRQVAGVGGLVCPDGILPIRVSDAMIDAIREREIDGAVPGKTPAKLIFRLGQTVRITEGPFSGLTAQVEKLPDLAIEDIDSDTRIRIALDLFGRQTSTELPVSAIEKR